MAGMITNVRAEKKQDDVDASWTFCVRARIQPNAGFTVLNLDTASNQGDKPFAKITDSTSMRIAELELVGFPFEWGYSETSAADEPMSVVVCAKFVTQNPLSSGSGASFTPVENPTCQAFLADDPALRPPPA
jgi:hypothetical protein